MEHYTVCLQSAKLHGPHMSRKVNCLLVIDPQTPQKIGSRPVFSYVERLRPCTFIQWLILQWTVRSMQGAVHWRNCFWQGKEISMDFLLNTAEYVSVMEVFSSDYNSLWDCEKYFSLWSHVLQPKHDDPVLNGMQLSIKWTFYLPYTSGNFQMYWYEPRTHLYFLFNLTWSVRCCHG